MQLQPQIIDIFEIGSGLLWTIAYMLVIRRGFLDKKYGIPLLAVCANISWEFIFSMVYPMDAPQIYVNYVWFIFDIIILYQVIAYGKNVFGKKVGKIKYFLFVLIILIMSYFAIITITLEFSDFQGKYSAFSQNLMMSILFVFMLIGRKSTHGQSIYIGISKMIGTILPSILFYTLYPKSYFLIYLYFMIFIFDILYVLMLYKQMIKEGKNPFRVI